MEDVGLCERPFLIFLARRPQYLEASSIRSPHAVNCPNFVPKIESQPVPPGPNASHPHERVTAMSSEIGALMDASERSKILLTSLIMLRSLVRFQLAPPSGTV